MERLSLDSSTPHAPPLSSILGRIVHATDALQSFQPVANASFCHFQVDVSRELKLLTDLTFIKGTLGLLVVKEVFGGLRGGHQRGEILAWVR